MSNIAHTSPEAPRVSSQDRLLAMIQAKHPGYHPVLAMVEIAQQEMLAGDEGDRALAFACHKEVAKYTVIVDRHTEIKSEVVKTRRVLVELFGSEQKPTETLQLAADESQVLEPVRSESPTAVETLVERTVVRERGPVVSLEEHEVEESMTKRFE